MSNAALNFAQALRLPPSQKLTLWALANRANKNNLCWPSMKTLSKDTCLSQATLKRVLAELERKEIISRQPRYDDRGRQISNMIELLGIGEELKKDHDTGSWRWPKGANSNPGEGLTLSPAGSSGCCSSDKEEPKYKSQHEPLNICSGEELASEPPCAMAPVTDGEVTYVGGELLLHASCKSYWLAEFGGSEKRLELALKQAAGWIRTNRGPSLSVQVASQLAKQIADKLERDERYAAAAKPKPSGGTRKVSRYGVEA